MSETPPPPQFAQYPRGPMPAQYGSSDRLRALYEGYQGLSIVFVVNIGLAAASRAMTMNSPFDIKLLGGVVLITFFVIGGLSYPYNKKIALGKGWDPAYAILASFLMGINSALCCGIIGYAIMQQIALNEIRRYGVPKSTLLGFKKRDLLARIEELRAAESMPPAATAVPSSSPDNPQ